MGELGVDCAPYLPSIHLQPYMRERYGFARGPVPGERGRSARTMAIPFHARLAREDQERVADALRASLRVAARAIIPAWPTASRAWSSSASASTRAPTRSTRSSRSAPGERGHGARTRVWVEGIAEPIVASRTERAIIAAMGGEPARRGGAPRRRARPRAARGRGGRAGALRRGRPRPAGAAAARVDARPPSPEQLF